MARIRSQDYDVDNRYSQTQLKLTGQSAGDNSSGKQYLKNYIEKDRLRALKPIAPDNRDENKFIIPALGGLVPPSGNIGNTDAKGSYRNQFKASQKHSS